MHALSACVCEVYSMILPCSMHALSECVCEVPTMLLRCSLRPRTTKQEIMNRAWASSQDASTSPEPRSRIRTFSSSLRPVPPWTADHVVCRENACYRGIMSRHRECVCQPGCLVLRWSLRLGAKDHARMGKAWARREDVPTTSQGRGYRLSSPCPSLVSPWRQD